MLRPLVVLMALAVPLAAAPVPKALKKQLSLDGRWQTLERFVLGEDVSATQPMEWAVEGGKLTMYNRLQDGTTTLTDPDATVTLTPPGKGAANELDFLFVDGTRRQLFKGLSEWNGDELSISFGQPDADRPTEVKSTSSVYHYRFKRVADK